VIEERITKRPDESREDYIRRIVASAGRLDPTTRALVRRLLPPIPRSTPTKAA
jgi:hypothetical protein